MDILTEEQRQKIMILHKDKMKNINELMTHKTIDGVFIPISYIEMQNGLKKIDYEHTCNMNNILGIPLPQEPNYIN